MAAMTMTLDDAYAGCATLVKERARSFYFASRFLPPGIRRSIYALYAFCRMVDDIADTSPAGVPPRQIVASLDAWRDWLLAGAPWRDGDPIAYAFGHVIHTTDLPIAPLLDLLAGLRDDAAPRHLPDRAALDRYCYCVAGTVGIAVSHVLGARSEQALRHACDLGIAMQLTNILRDVSEDLERGRIYLPSADMARFGYTRADLEAGVIDDRFIALLQSYIVYARSWYASGLAGIELLPRETRFAIMLAAQTYAAILTKIEGAGFDVLSQRVHTRRADKLLLLCRLLARSLAQNAVSRKDNRNIIIPLR